MTVGDLHARLPFIGPFAFVARTWVPHVRPAPVVYRLRALDAEGGGFRAIGRAGGVDTSGTLDVGESGNGARRLLDFCLALEGKPRSHRAGWEFSPIGYDFGSVFPSTALSLELLHVSSKELAEAIELALLEEYRWRFKDRPPLNGSAGKGRKVCAWLEGQGRRPRTPEGWLDLAGLLPT